MSLAALIIGLLTAYDFGLTTGGVAAAAAVLLFIIAAAVPGALVPIYCLIGVSITVLLVVGPRLSPSEDTNKFRRLGKAVLAQGWRQLRSLFGGRS